MAERVIVARIGAPHGVRGEMKLWPFTQDPMAVMRYGALETEDGRQRFEIETVRPAKDHLVVRLKGVDDRSSAEKLTNTNLYIPRERLPVIEDSDTYYNSDLIGLDAIGEDGAQIGTVHAVHDFGAGAVVEIAPVGSSETLMLPFTSTTVPKVDLEAKQIVIVPPAEVETKEA